MQSLGMINASLKNHTVLITGGGSGIGFSTAELFAKMNANVVINYLSDDKDSKKRVFDLRRKYTNVTEFPGDVSIENVSKGIVQEIKKKFNGLNFLINNVGIGLVKDPISFQLKLKLLILATSLVKML